MGLVVHKYEVRPGRFTVSMPRGAKVLDAQAQQLVPGEQDGVMWALVDPAEPEVKRNFLVVGTGHDTGCNFASSLEHIGTWQMATMLGSLVWHLFEELG